MDNIYVGIDVAKEQLDVWLHPINRYFKVKNDNNGVQKIKEELQKHDVKIIVMEATGGYEYLVSSSLATEYHVSVVSPYFASSFKHSFGKLTKTDIIDAQSLALFAEKVQPREQGVLTAVQKEMKELLFRKQQLDEMIIQENNRLQTVVSKDIAKSQKQHIKYLEKQKDKIISMLLDKVKQSDEYKEKFEILQSIPEIGPIIALNLLCDVPELGTLNKRQIASLVGLAPHNKQSGSTFKNGKTLRGRRLVKSALFLGVMAAVRFNKDFKRNYEHLLNNDTCKMVALTACARKLVIIANTLIKEKRKWRN